jgi:putative ABC transport system ATP-binding protein
MSVPFTIGKLIDYFSSTTPVRVIFHIHRARHSVDIYSSQQIPYGFSLGQASAILLLMFTTGALANAGRAFLMRMSGL